MTKKLGWIGVIVVALLVVVVGMVSAQEPTPQAGTPVASDGTCRCQCENTCVLPQRSGLRNADRGGMRRGDVTPALVAKALDMTVADLSTALDAGQTITQLAESKGMAVADVAEAVVAPRIERINQAVANGNLTREQADEQIATLREHTLQRLTEGFTFGTGTRGWSDGARPMPGGMRGGMRGGMGRDVATPALVAEALDMTVADLSTALDAGQTIAQLAEAKGLTLDDVVDAIVAPHLERINQAVANGNLTQEQADAQIATLKEHMLQRLTDGFSFGTGTRGWDNDDRPVPGPMPGGMRGGGMRGRGNGLETPVQPEATPEL
ncbi:MAG: hypothetical protein JXA21_19460 [Anaerolineae bacterium]|nr:hypothetical protein [Anaerolineae bacterium]